MNFKDIIYIALFALLIGSQVYQLRTIERLIHIDNVNNEINSVQNQVLRELKNKH